VPAASGKYDCIFPTIVGKRRLRLGLQKLLQTNIYEVNVKAIFPTIVGKRGLRLREEVFLSNIYEEYIQKGAQPLLARGNLVV
jgi:hypothetical protein